VRRLRGAASAHPSFAAAGPQEDETFDLARRPLPQFSLSLAKSFGAFFFLMGLPVSCFTFEFSKEPAQCLLSAAAGSLFIVTVGAGAAVVAARRASFGAALRGCRPGPRLSGQKVCCETRRAGGLAGRARRDG
jgi:hypothetical protein